MSRSNGGIIGKANAPTSTVASGMWSLAAAELAKRGGNWPDLFSGTALRLDFNETTTLDSRITFTRATNGTYFVHVEQLSSEVLLASFALGALSCAILTLNNLRDLPKDAQVGKRTLAVILGDAQSRDLYRWLIFFALVISAALSIFSPYYLLALISAPLAIKSVRSVKQGASGMELVDLLAKTGRIQIIYAAALSLAALLVAR